LIGNYLNKVSNGILYKKSGAKKAKKKPASQINPEKILILIDHFLLAVQARAKSGSIGHGAFRFVKIRSALPKIIKPETLKTRILFSESQTICGNTPINPANAAPIPIETKRLGSAQQIMVPKDENNDR